MLAKHALSDKYLLRLGKIFKNKKWEIEECSNGELPLFDRFCIRLDELECDEDREFILDLTEEYLYLQLDKYEQYLIEVFRKLIAEEKEVLKNMKAIHVFPVQDKEYTSKTKSGHVMCYLIQGVLSRRFPEFHDKEIRIIETYEGVKKHKDEIELLLLIDDYIGSGDSALACINMLEEIKIEKNRMRIVTLVSQKVGKEAIEDYGVKQFTFIERVKGISDAYPKEEVEQKIEQMKRIGKRIKVDKRLYLGYKDSEALITTIKTPNNTFPFYWHECETTGKYTYAPFPRRKNVGVKE